MFFFMNYDKKKRAWKLGRERGRRKEEGETHFFFVCLFYFFYFFMLLCFFAFFGKDPFLAVSFLQARKGEEKG